MTNRVPFRYFKTTPEIIRPAAMMYIRFPLSLRNVEDLLHDRCIDICHKTVRFWWHRFGPLFAAEIRKRRVSGMRSSRWRRHLDEVFVKINGELHDLWRAVDHEGEVLKSFVTKTRDKKAALRELGISDRQETGHWASNRAENSHQQLRRRERAMLRFRRMRTLRKFISVHASISNHFN